MILLFNEISNIVSSYQSFEHCKRLLNFQGGNINLMPTGYPFLCNFDIDLTTGGTGFSLLAPSLSECNWQPLALAKILSPIAFCISPSLADTTQRSANILDRSLSSSQSHQRKHRAICARDGRGAHILSSWLQLAYIYYKTQEEPYILNIYNKNEFLRFI